MGREIVRACVRACVKSCGRSFIDSFNRIRARARAPPSSDLGDLIDRLIARGSSVRVHTSIHSRRVRACIRIREGERDATTRREEEGEDLIDLIAREIGGG